MPSWAEGTWPGPLGTLPSDLSIWDTASSPGLRGKTSKEEALAVLGRREKNYCRRLYVPEVQVNSQKATLGNLLVGMKGAYGAAPQVSRIWAKTQQILAGKWSGSGSSPQRKVWKILKNSYVIKVISPPQISVLCIIVLEKTKWGSCSPQEFVLLCQLLLFEVGPGLNPPSTYMGLWWFSRLSRLEGGWEPTTLNHLTSEEL